MRNGIMAVFLVAAVATVSPWAIADDDITEAHLEDMDLISADRLFDRQTERRLW